MVDAANSYTISMLYPLVARATYPRLGFAGYPGEVSTSDASDDDKEAARKAAEDDLPRHLDVYPQFFLNEAGFIGGDSPTIADIRLACTLEFLAVTDTALPELGDGLHAARRVGARRRVQRARRRRARLHRAGHRPGGRRLAPRSTSEEPMLDVEHVDFIAVPVRDLKRADDFYGKTLGLTRSPGSGDRWVEYDTENVTIALISPEAMGPQFLEDFQPNKVPIALRVPNVEEARAKLTEAGLEVADVIDSGVCHIAGFHDPDGNALILHRRYAPYADGSTP